MHLAFGVYWKQVQLHVLNYKDQVENEFLSALLDRRRRPLPTLPPLSRFRGSESCDCFFSPKILNEF